MTKPIGDENYSRGHQMQNGLSRDEYMEIV
jgi:hypothetical protein